MKTIPITTTQTVLVSFEKAKHICYQVRGGAQLTLVVIARKALDAVLEIDLLEEDCRAIIAGAVIGDGDSLINLKTYQNHKAPHTTSDLLIKSVMNDASTFSYTGVIKVSPGAQQTNAYQRNDSLMLSPQAHTITSPALEILADDVRCTHGATIGDIDETQLFYLHSRGIPQLQAEALIIEGFLLSVTDRVQDEKERSYFVEQIKKTLHH